MPVVISAPLGVPTQVLPKAIKLLRECVNARLQPGQFRHVATSTSSRAHGLASALARSKTWQNAVPH